MNEISQEEKVIIDKIKQDKQEVLDCENLAKELFNKLESVNCSMVIYHTVGSDGTNRFESVIKKK